jgi:hypothetical protein
MNRSIKLVSIALLAAFIILQTGAVLAKPQRTSQLYYNDTVVRTLVPSGKPLKNPGIDPLYAFPNDEVDGMPQYSVTRYAPGDKEYKGGHWAVWIVTWNTEPYLITSYSGIQTAIADGDIDVTRNEAADVLCPVLPGKSMW